jgi:hypothetical protein
MTTRKSKHTKRDIARVLKFLEDIDWLFSLNNFDRVIKLPAEDDEDVVAEVNFDEKYQRINVRLYPCFFAHTLDEQRKALLHELCHSITIPSKVALHDALDGDLVTKKRANEINETTTSKIENILDGLLRGKLRYARNAYKNYLKPYVTRKTKKRTNKK